MCTIHLNCNDDTFMLLISRGVAWTTHGQNPCDFK
jgi:hypothetical protein